jgi:hypothetical protein
MTQFSELEFICGTHIVYGWMPTVLDLNPTNIPNGLKRGAELLTQVKETKRLTDIEIALLAKLVNNSLVGTSKLLHFTAPNAFAIWDSKIYAFVFQEKAHNYRVNQVGKYREYISRLDQLKRRPGFEAFHQSVNEKVGYEISALRAIELIMFVNGG